MLLFIIFYFCHVWLLPLGSLFFYNERQKGGGIGGEGKWEGLGGVEGKYCMRKEFIFNKRKEQTTIKQNKVKRKKMWQPIAYFTVTLVYTHGLNKDLCIGSVSCSCYRTLVTAT